MKRQAVEKLIADAIIEHEHKHKIVHVKALLEALRDLGIRVDIQEPYDLSRGDDCK